MFTNLSEINRSFFFMRPCVVGGDQCVLIEPHEVGVAKWNKDNLIFRSSIWNSDGKLVSAGFPKFFNWDEDLEYTNRKGEVKKGSIPIAKPEAFAYFMDKLDGSCLIVSFYKGELIIRTRGTINAETTLSNGYEIGYLRDKYPKTFAFFEELRRRSTFTDVDVSLIFEWYSPKNRIVISYGDEPQLWLTGQINHEDYSFASQDHLDRLSALIDVPRPERYPITGVEGLRALVAALRGKEGVVAYGTDGWPWKWKSLQYLSLHYSKGRVNTFDKVIDTWLEFGRPDYQTFFDKLVEKEDWETADYARPSISKISDLAKRVAEIQRGMQNFIDVQLSKLPRKEQFLRAQAAYGNTNRTGMVMALLDGRPLSDEAVKKLIMQLNS